MTKIPREGYRGDISDVLDENELLREEVQVARRASDITAQLVVEQFVKIEKMLQRLEESEMRYRTLYQQTSSREKLYSSLLNSTPDAVVISDVHNATIYINPSFTRIFGFTEKDVLGRQIPFVPQAEELKTGNVVKQVLAGAPLSYFDTARLTKDGSVRDITLSASCYLDHEGGPAGVIMILRDVTEPRHAERLLQKQRETFFTILEKAPYGVALLDRDDRFVYFNSEITKTTGYTPDDIPTLDQWFQRAYPDPQYRQTVMSAWGKQHSSAGKKTTFSICCSNGEKKDVEVRRTLLDDGRLFVMLSDVTEAKRAEGQIRKAKEEWERTFDSIEDVVTIQDSRMRILRVNRSAANLVGAHPKELIGRYCHEVFHGRSSPCQGCPELETIEDHLPHSAEVEGGYGGRTYLVTASPIFDEAGAFSGIVHSAKDITEKRLIEEELLKTQKLDSLGILAGGIAHDFNNILTAIMGNISLSKLMTQKDDKVSKRLDEAERACLRAKDLTHQLLTFSKGGAPIKRAVSLDGLVRDSASFALMGSNVRCEFDIPRDLWTAEVDEGQISQVLHNLIINACQAMPGGGVIRISAENKRVSKICNLPLRPGTYILLSIRDQGTGIRPEHLSSIFDPYFSTKEQGNGLGLTTAYSIVKRHDGHIALDSKLGEGTTFSVYLPAAEKEASAREPRQGSVFGKGRALIMDDEEIIRDVVGQMLSFLGYESDSAEDGDKAIQLYVEVAKSGSPFDIVLMDLTIPGGKGGKDTMRELLRIDPHVKAIASSGYHTDPIMSNFREFGFKGVIAKPYRLDELSEVLAGVLAASPD